MIINNLYLSFISDKKYVMINFDLSDKEIA